MRPCHVELVIWGLFAVLDEADELADPEDGGGADDDDHPVDELEGHHAEELAAEFDNQYLAEEDAEGDDDKATAVLHVQGRAMCSKSFGIEHVPELKENECGEEETDLIGTETLVLAEECGVEELSERVDIDMLKIPHEAEEHSEEEETYGDDRTPHRGVDDEGCAGARRLGHDRL